MFRMQTDYNQSMNSPEACRKRLMKYLLPVLFMSIIFNIPKFFEASFEKSVLTAEYFDKEKNETVQVRTWEFVSLFY